MDWVLAVESAYVAIATRSGLDSAPRSGGAAPPGGAGLAAIELQLGRETPQRLAAASGAVASRFLAVGTPRSLSLVVDDETQHDFAALSLEAHRTWFSPRDVRCTNEALAARVGGRVVSIGEALAADIVCVHGSTIEIAAAALRRGTHVNVLGDPSCVDSELLALATVVDASSLPAMAAGFVDGRQLDELTLFRYG